MPEEQDVKIRKFLDINGATAALLRTIATLIHEKTKEQINELCKAQYMSNMIKDKNEIKQLQVQVETIIQQYRSKILTLYGQITHINKKLQLTITKKNTLKNAIGVEKVEILLKETGYYELKEYYEEMDESDCASITKNEHSNDESMANSLNDRFRNLAILPSMKAIGKRPERKELIEKKVYTKQEVL
ncbi:hypothetical protein C1645_742473 [Glomus cerebriforme]|uniref:Uncharacterized protein n=1 Tax=Glomus cerebriforme TaxID=658196 RepID=A0A397SHX1_9GLOM|nr:hypothetical protein C1645_742473 [Glomus cerebriforme]